MTTIVFKSGHLTVASSAWTATVFNRDDERSESVQIHVPQRIDCCTLTLNMAEFLALVAEAPKVLDLRPWQVVRFATGNRVAILGAGADES